MDKQASLIAILIVSIAGLLFSGYLSFYELVLKHARLEEDAGHFLDCRSVFTDL